MLDIYSHFGQKTDGLENQAYRQTYCTKVTKYVEVVERRKNIKYKDIFVDREVESIIEILVVEVYDEYVEKEVIKEVEVEKEVVKTGIAS